MELEIIEDGNTTKRKHIEDVICVHRCDNPGIEWFGNCRGEGTNSITLALKKGTTYEIENTSLGKRIYINALKEKQVEEVRV